MDKISLQKTFPGFEQGLYDEIIAHGLEKTFRAGDVLLRVGQPIRSTILILEGLVKLYRDEEGGKEFFIYNLHAGQACSLSLVCATRHETSEVLAKALTDGIMLTIPLEFMDKWMRGFPGWYQFVITSYRDRFEELLRTIDAIAFTNMDERLAFYLDQQADKLGPVLKITHQDIANDLNTSREVVSRLLKKMEAKGWVLVNRNSLEWIKK